ncbi:hypothetical protein AMECASPLE_039694 [Ameca splendens]|uniref:RNA polymerase sigma-70 ECF-like HTH domain-containing protein n=1 Tax=Ameca splendens TaxID=208324 RepID=A0ABV0Y8K7_9TELE
MALPQIVQTLLELAEQVESSSISESDARDRVEQVMETLAAYSAVIDLNINEVAIVNLRSVLERLDAVEPQMGRGRPTINIPFESIEIYLLNGFKVHEIAELFGVGHQTIRRRMQSNGLR